MTRKGARVSKGEGKLREYRRRNLDYLLATEMTTRQYLARKLDAEPNYISQMRHGHRPISDETARKIEEVVGLTHRSLDDPSIEQSVDRLTESEIAKRVQLVLKDECKRRKIPARGPMYKAAEQLAVIDARERGYSEARVRFIAQEFLG